MPAKFHHHISWPGHGWIEPFQDSECPLIEAATAEDIVKHIHELEASIERAYREGFAAAGGGHEPQSVNHAWNSSNAKAFLEGEMTAEEAILCELTAQAEAWGMYLPPK